MTRCDTDTCIFMNEGSTIYTSTSLWYSTTQRSNTYQPKHFVRDTPKASPHARRFFGYMPDAMRSATHLA